MHQHLFYWYVKFHSIWWKGIFVTRFLKKKTYMSPQSTVMSETWRQDDAPTVYRNTPTLYHASYCVYGIMYCNNLFNTKL